MEGEWESFAEAEESFVEERLTGMEESFARAEELLREGEFQDCRVLWHSSNYVYLARLCGPSGETFGAIYKPLRGESPLWDFPEGLYRREVAAYQLAQLLRWPIVPPTVMRDGPQGPGSLQLYISHDPQSHFFVQREDPELVPQLKRMAVFDFVANNADRKGGHCLLDEDRHVWGIDHGLCFHEQYKLRSVIWDWAGEPVPDPLWNSLYVASESLTIEAEEARPLMELLTTAEVKALKARLMTLLETRRFPEPGPHRHYPWPLV